MGRATAPATSDYVEQFRQRIWHEYYPGTVEPAGCWGLRFDVENGLRTPFPINKMRAMATFSYVRSAEHIRASHADIAIIWFVRRGRLTVSSGNRACIVEPGQLTITRSNRPLRVQASPAGDSVYEDIHILIPSHVLQSHLPGGIPTLASNSFLEGNLRVAEQILDVLHGQRDRVDAAVAQMLSDCFLRALGRQLTVEHGSFDKRKTAAEHHYDNIVGCIDMHMANCDISVSFVADHVKISPRQLCYILAGKGTSFAKLLWGKRLERASEFLRKPEMGHYSVSEIAYLVGYKSAGHFSRMFKNRYGAAPTQMRRHMQDQPTLAHA